MSNAVRLAGPQKKTGVVSMLQSALLIFLASSYVIAFENRVIELPSSSGEPSMDFVNEYASIEDIEKYELRALWDRFCPKEKGNYFSGKKPSFIIDRVRNTFMLTIGQGYGDVGNRKMFLLKFRGEEILFDLDLVDGSSPNINDRPFFRVWDLGYMKIPEHMIDQKDEIVSVIKEAVAVYGYRGISKQIPNTVVRFKF